MLAKQWAQLAPGFSNAPSSRPSLGLPLAPQSSTPMLALPQLLPPSAVAWVAKWSGLQIPLKRGAQPGRTLPHFLDMCRWEAGCDAGEARPARHDALHASALGTDATVHKLCQPRELSRPQTAGGLSLSLDTWKSF